ncbi:MAG: iron chaperone [Candidatus Limnocylindrales bacterium]
MAQKTAKSEIWTAEERAAMKEAAAEAKRAAKRGADSAAGEADVLAKIAEMPEPDRSMAVRIHEIVKAAVPELVSKTWYGMPAYTKDGKSICFFQAASKFNVRYATFGFQPDARLDDGAMWANAFAVLELTPVVEKRIAALVKQAAG